MILSRFGFYTHVYVSTVSNDEIHYIETLCSSLQYTTPSVDYKFLRLVVIFEVEEANRWEI